MSLELAIKENTATLEKLIAVLTEAIPALPQSDAENTVAITATPAEIEQPDPPKTKRARKEAAVEPRPLEQLAPSPEPSAPDASATAAAATAEDEPPAYGDVAPFVTRVAKEKGKAAVLELLGRFGAQHFSQVDAEQYAAVLAAAKEILGE